jgi:1-acyl-sn-glycerol-3-phosphate acyltransferase
MKTTLLRTILRFLIRMLSVILMRIEVHGLNNLPPEGGYIVAANHLGRLDVPLVYHLLNRDDIIMLVAEKYRKIGIARSLVSALDAIWLDRFTSDFQALRQTLDRLKAGGVLVIAPEGTRSTTGGLLPGKQGASYLASKTGLPVVPVAVIGTEDERARAQLKRLKRPSVLVQVGKPFRLPPAKGSEREAVLERNTDEIMCRIAALLPATYRGVYADHPRLKELV